MFISFVCIQNQIELPICSWGVMSHEMKKVDEKIPIKMREKKIKIVSKLKQKKQKKSLKKPLSKG